MSTLKLSKSAVSRPKTNFCHKNAFKNRYVDVKSVLDGPSDPDAKSNISWFFTTVPFIIISAFLLKYALF